MHPTSGAVYIDGVDLRQLDPADCAATSATSARMRLLFYGSLRDNIAIGAPMPTTGDHRGGRDGRPRPSSSTATRRDSTC
jgi:ABC-type multidrug transport system fused ATPase/permease subunit